MSLIDYSKNSDGENVEVFYILQMLSLRHSPVAVGIFNSVEEAKKVGESLCDDYWDDFEYLPCEMNGAFMGFSKNLLAYYTTTPKRISHKPTKANDQFLLEEIQFYKNINLTEAEIAEKLGFNNVLHFRVWHNTTKIRQALRKEKEE